MNEAPVPTNVPPVGALYQLIVPALAVALNVKVPASHLLAGVVPVIVGIVFTVATTAVLGASAHPAFVASA